MTSYANLNGNSNIVSYEFDSDSIDVMFRDGSVYRYTYASAGVHNVETMKSLALSGYGLNSYIMRYCRFGYESKSR